MNHNAGILSLTSDEDEDKWTFVAVNFALSYSHFSAVQLGNKKLQTKLTTLLLAETGQKLGNRLDDIEVLDPVGASFDIRSERRNLNRKCVNYSDNITKYVHHQPQTRIMEGVSLLSASVADTAQINAFQEQSRM